MAQLAGGGPCSSFCAATGDPETYNIKVEFYIAETVGKSRKVTLFGKAVKGALSLTSNCRKDFESNTQNGVEVESVLSIIDGKFKCIILSYLIDGEMRYNDLRNRIGSISDRTLANQLRELEVDGLVIRTEYDCMPKRVEYGLTDAGRQLKPVMALMHDWAVANIKYD